MTIGDRESLIARIRQLRRAAPDVALPSRGATEHAEPDRVAALEARVEHLEQLLEGLQDSVHRESARQGKLIVELESRVQPSATGAALNRDARQRGL